MKNLQLNYETLIKITKSLSKSKDPETIISLTVESIKSSLGIKGCALLLINTQTKDLEVAASAGLSRADATKAVDGVLDAISNVSGLDTVSSKKIWVARPTSDNCKVQVLPVDWYAVTENGQPHTNYQILPGDRVFIAEDKLVAFDTHIAKHLGR